MSDHAEYKPKDTKSLTRPSNRLPTAGELGLRDKREERREGLCVKRQAEEKHYSNQEKTRVGNKRQNAGKNGPRMEKKNRNIYLWEFVNMFVYLKHNHQMCPSIYPGEAHKKEAREGTWHLKSREHQDTTRCGK